MPQLFSSRFFIGAVGPSVPPPLAVPDNELWLVKFVGLVQQPLTPTPTFTATLGGSTEFYRHIFPTSGPDYWQEDVRWVFNPDDVVIISCDQALAAILTGFRFFI